MTKHLLAYARKGHYELKNLNLNQVVRETSESSGMTRKNITIHRELAEDLLEVRADQAQIEQVLRNLYVNAADAMPGGGEGTVLSSAPAAILCGRGFGGHYNQDVAGYHKKIGTGIFSPSRG